MIHIETAEMYLSGAAEEWVAEAIMADGKRFSWFRSSPTECIPKWDRGGL
jgi:hypothetical protein